MLPYGTASRWAAGLVLASLVLAGCVRSGDLGRPHQFEALHAPPKEKHLSEKDALAQTALAHPQIANAPLTDDERQLRALAGGLIAGAPAEPPSRFGFRSDPPPRAEAPEAQRDRYADYLARGPFRSASARYSRLIDDTRDDIARLEPFFHLARRVADYDGKRRRALDQIRGLPREERASAERRMRENMMLMEEVHRTMRERAMTYRVALERLVVAVPSPLAVDAERTRLDLERQLAGIRVAGGGELRVRA